MLCVVLSYGKIEQSGELDMRAPEELTQFSSPRHVVHITGKQYQKCKESVYAQAFGI